MTIFPNQRVSVAEPLSMKLFAGDVSDLDELYQPSTSKQAVAADESIQENDEEVLEQSAIIDPDEPVDENQSPNATTKRLRPVEIKKSTKKHASSEAKFRSFEINWNKLSDNVVSKLNSLYEFKTENPDTSIPPELRITKSDTTNLINNIVDQLRAIDTDIKASVMETVSKQLISKFPCLEKVDDDGYRNGISYIALKHKMINHNAYLNRFRKSSEQSTPSSSRGRNVRAGTLKSYWENWKKECEKEVLAKLRRDEPALLTDEFLEVSQPFVRYKLNYTKDLAQLLLELPVLRRRGLLNYHFAQATGICIEDLRKYYVMKRSKIISYSETASRKFVKLCNESNDLEVLRFLASLVGEKIGDLIVNKEIGTRLNEIQLETSGPLLVSVGKFLFAYRHTNKCYMGQNTSMFYVYADQARVTEGTADIICAVQDLMAIHYVHNFKYMKLASKFLELLQQYFLKITPSCGSKSNAYRVGNQQRVVQKVIDNLSEFQ
uniref:Uncharacterized protein n=1 Tax=Aedes aegypti TaxID=7159 RepID=A0A0P6J0M2_AEDAE